ncbi:MAG: protease modulator HflC [Gemmataceae bacterium]|nr:protease modulator HflC [Gemmataceae bacterium]
MRSFALAILLIVGLVLTAWSFYTVDAAEYAYVTVLGRPVAIHDGSKPDEAGLHFGWPWPIQSVRRIDRRLQSFDLAENEFLTRDRKFKAIDKTLTIQGFVCWRIPDPESADRFIRHLGSPERAREILGNRIQSMLSDSVGQLSMDDLISTEAGTQPGRTHVEQTVQKLTGELLSRLQPEARESYGIEIVDLRLRRFSHPPSVRSAIFERIKSERQRKVQEYASEAALIVSDIQSKAEAEAREKLAQAKFQEEKIKGEADAEAVRIRTLAQSQDPEFYAFLKKMETMQNILGEGRSVLLLSTHREIFDQLFGPPKKAEPKK